LCHLAKIPLKTWPFLLNFRDHPIFPLWAVLGECFISDRKNLFLERNRISGAGKQRLKKSINML